MMTIDELRDIIRDYGVSNDNDSDSFDIIRPYSGLTFSVGGCELLEHIDDVGGFVSLLRGFWRRGYNFIDDFPDPVRAILRGGVVFSLIEYRVYIANGGQYDYTYKGIIDRCDDDWYY